MNIPDSTVKILTLGKFNISVDGIPVTSDWPNETVKVLFCSLLSPLDLYFTWDRICRSLLGVPETRTSRRQLEELLIRPLNSFLISKLGFTPLITGLDKIKIDQRRIQVDALEFHSTAIEGLRLLALNNHAAALDKLNTANSLYNGCYLPGIMGKIIENTRNDLASFYRTAVIEGLRQAQLAYHVPPLMRKAA